MGLISFLRAPMRVAADRRGAGVIELAFVMPVLLLLLVGMIDTSRFIAARLDLEQAAQQTTDYALAKRPMSSDGTYLVNVATAAAGVPASDVTVDIYMECNGARLTSFSSSCPSGYPYGRFVSVSIKRPIQTIFNWAALTHLFGANVIASTITVTGDSVVRIQ